MQNHKVQKVHLRKVSGDDVFLLEVLRCWCMCETWEENLQIFSSLALAHHCPFLLPQHSEK